MRAPQFQKFCDIAYRQAGISLREGKEALVSARVSKRVRALGLRDSEEYLRFLESDPTGGELVSFLDVITTNFTRFFREPDHFDDLREALERWYGEGQRRFRIWSAASSTGEEPYSIAITVLETLAGRGADVRILATDISTRVLATASEGRYGESATRAMSPGLRSKYFDRVPGSEAIQVRKVVRDIVTFKRLNLAQGPFPMKGPLDVVFCRNVMIYFDRPVRQQLVSEAERLMRPGGLLLIGHTETLTGISTGLSVLRPSVYSNASWSPSRPGMST